MHDSNKLSLVPLVALVIGSMIAAGIFNLPIDIAAGSGVLGIICGWTISGAGMLILALSFQILSQKKPEVVGSIYGYAKEGFSNYMGFTSAFGYWLSGITGNVCFLVIMFAALSNLTDVFGIGKVFGAGNNLIATIAESVLLWVIFGLIMCGISTAMFINVIITIAKVIPLVLFLIIAVIFFNWDVFKANFMPESLRLSGSSLISQIKETMLVTVFVLIGVEGASLYSSRAKRTRDVGLATIIGFAVAVTLLVLISVLSLGLVPREELLAMDKPATASLLTHFSSTRYIGLYIINGGLIISVLGALLSWALLACELPFIASRDANFPRIFGRQDKNDTPTVSLFITTLLTQLFLIACFFIKEAYHIMVCLCSSVTLLPYLFTVLYYLKECIKNRSCPQPGPGGTAALFTTKDLVLSSVASIYVIWLVYAGGLGYLLISMILYGLGFFIYFWARLDARQPIYESKIELIQMLVVAALFVLGIIYFCFNYEQFI